MSVVQCKAVKHDVTRLWFFGGQIGGRRFEPARGGLGVEYISLQMVANKKTPPAIVQTNGVTFFGES